MTLTTHEAFAKGTEAAINLTARRLGRYDAHFAGQKILL